MFQYLVRAMSPAIGERPSMLVPCLSVFACNSLMYLFCQIKKDNSFIDVWWGLSFIVPNVALIAL